MLKLVLSTFSWEIELKSLYKNDSNNNENAIINQTIVGLNPNKNIFHRNFEIVIMSNALSYLKPFHLEKRSIINYSNQTYEIPLNKFDLSGNNISLEFCDQKMHN